MLTIDASVLIFMSFFVFVSTSFSVFLVAPLIFSTWLVVQYGMPIQSTLCVSLFLLLVPLVGFLGGAVLDRVIFSEKLEIESNCNIFSRYLPFIVTALTVQETFNLDHIARLISLLNNKQEINEFFHITSLSLAILASGISWVSISALIILALISVVDIIFLSQPFSFLSASKVSALKSRQTVLTSNIYSIKLIFLVLLISFLSSKLLSSLTEHLARLP